MEGFVKQSLLYDFYGDLLTAHQKHIYGLYVLDNLSLGEIAEDEGISRQGVHDIIKRCNAQLEGYEAKLKLVEKFISIRDKVESIQNCNEIEKARDLAEQILEML